MVFFPQMCIIYFKMFILNLHHMLTGEVGIKKGKRKKKKQTSEISLLRVLDKKALCFQGEREKYFSCIFFRVFVEELLKKTEKPASLTEQLHYRFIYKLESLKTSTAGTQKLPVCFTHGSHTRVPTQNTAEHFTPCSQTHLQNLVGSGPRCSCGSGGVKTLL